jgi:hypothetical protein
MLHPQPHQLLRRRVHWLNRLQRTATSMLLILSSACTIALLFMLIRSLIWTRRFLRGISNYPSSPPATLALDAPRAVVVLAVRGQDPFLARCIESLLNQNYPNYILRIVIDSESDPSVPVIEGAVSMYSTERVRVEYLYDVRETCGAKNSALLQVVESLEPADSAIVVVDSDVVAYADWLGDLMQPLLDPKVGVSTGMRWYTPASSELGTLVRYVWNIGSVPEMVAFQVPFGGSCAYRRDVLEGGLAERWSQCLFDDCVVPSVLKPLGLELRVVPRAIMANCESISLGRCFEFLRRQMLNAMCYAPAGHWVLAGSLMMAASMFGGFGLLFAAISQSDQTALTIVATGLALYVVGMAGCAVILEMKLRPILRQSGQIVPSLPLKVFFVGGLTVVMYTSATIGACFLRRVSWRGLAYRRVGYDQFRMEEHRPYKSSTTFAQAEHASV